MPRLALLIEYAGEQFCGSQYQVGQRTVQAELEKALSTVARAPISCIFSSRTDTGVHSCGQVAHCDWTDDALDLWKLNWAINGILPADMAVSKMVIAPEQFHARYDAVRRQYVYRILNTPQRSALLRQNHHFVPRQLQLEAMAEAAGYLLGEHDFKAFKSTNSDRVTSICRVSQAELLNLGEGVLEFWIAANHFVYNMVRIIVGTLVEIGLGKRQPDSLSKALSSGNRNLAGPTAPPWGLCLYSVQYPEAYKLFA